MPFASYKPDTLAVAKRELLAGIVNCPGETPRPKFEPAASETVIGLLLVFEILNDWGETGTPALGEKSSGPGTLKSRACDAGASQTAIVAKASLNSKRRKFSPNLCNASITSILG